MVDSLHGSEGRRITATNLTVEEMEKRRPARDSQRSHRVRQGGYQFLKNIRALSQGFEGGYGIHPLNNT